MHSCTLPYLTGEFIAFASRGGVVTHGWQTNCYRVAELRNSRCRSLPRKLSYPPSNWFPDLWLISQGAFVVISPYLSHPVVIWAFCCRPDHIHPSRSLSSPKYCPRTSLLLSPLPGLNVQSTLSLTQCPQLSKCFPWRFLDLKTYNIVTKGVVRRRKSPRQHQRLPTTQAAVFVHGKWSDIFFPQRGLTLSLTVVKLSRFFKLKSPKKSL